MKMKLTNAEKAILDGSQGGMMQQVMKTIVAYGEALEAEALADITGMGHFVIANAIPGISPSVGMLDSLVEAGLKTIHAFTLDPAAPLDYENWWLTPEQIETLSRMYVDQERYDRRMLALGLRDMQAFTCTPYQPEVGSIPQRGDILAWSESACVVFANSVLGARCNRNGAIIDLLCNIAGKVPLSGLLTDAGRRATWKIHVATQQLPLPQILGAAVGRMVLGDVPYITGLDGFLGPGIDGRTRDYLHELGAAAAAAGAVGLLHVENITPEAVDFKAGLLDKEYRQGIIDDADLEDLTASYPVLWEDPHADPEKCFLGCPHLSLRQLSWWANQIRAGLERHGSHHFKVNTTMCAAPQVLEKFKGARGDWATLTEAGVRFSSACPMQAFDNDLSRHDAIITNSNKLRTYTHARFFPDNEIVDIIITGRIRRGP